MIRLFRLSKLAKRGSSVDLSARILSGRLYPSPNLGRVRPAVSIPTPLIYDYFANELFGLWLVEFFLCVLLMYHLATATIDRGLRLHAAEQAVFTASVVSLISFAIGVYGRDLHLRIRALLLRSLLAIPIIGLVASAIGVGITQIYDVNPQLTLEVFAGWAVLLICLRLSCSYAVHANRSVRRLIVVATEESSSAKSAQLIEALEQSENGLYEVAVVLPVCQAAQLTADLLEKYRIWGIVVCAEAQAIVLDQLAASLPCRIWTGGTFWESQLRRVDTEHPFGGWHQVILGEPDRLKERARRGVDILLSVVLLAAASLPMLFIAILIKLDSPGPVFYRQKRVGLNGRIFDLLKFRSMYADAETSGPVWAAHHDPRVTRVGRVLRESRMDEVPQLLNVLRGEMGLVGPRPERPYFVKQLKAQLPLYNERARVKPGLTGWAQVNYPYGASVEDARAKLSYDLYYVKHRSLILDVLILISTVRVVVSRKGAR